MMLKGMTAEYLLLRCARVARGDTILFHAAAGGVGSIACQWAKHLGLRVIGTAGGPTKVALAAARGCDHVIDYDREDVVARVKELTGGAGVTAVFDGVGKRTFDASLACLATRGMLVLFGQASGWCRPSIRLLLAGHRCSSPARCSATTSRRATSWSPPRRACSRSWRSGAVKIDVGQSYALWDAAAAHRDLEARKTTGSTLLIP